MKNLLKFHLIFFFLIYRNICFAQYGYAITTNNDTIKGYVKYQRNYSDKHLEVEVWETKRDKNPKRHPLNKIKEYTLKKDTIRILRNCEIDFGNKIIQYDKIELKLEADGAITLYSNTINSAAQYGGLNSSKTYFIEDNYDVIRLIRSNNIKKDIDQFFDFEKYRAYLRAKKFRYSDLKTLVKYYNLHN